jgi:hypothetical protein
MDINRAGDWRNERYSPSFSEPPLLRCFTLLGGYACLQTMLTVLTQKPYGRKRNELVFKLSQHAFFGRNTRPILNFID